jgi:hypothetical protein
MDHKAQAASIAEMVSDAQSMRVGEERDYLISGRIGPLRKSGLIRSIMAAHQKRTDTVARFNVVFKTITEEETHVTVKCLSARSMLQLTTA